jgi:hypothetical protein
MEGCRFGYETVQAYIPDQLAVLKPTRGRESKDFAVSGALQRRYISPFTILSKNLDHLLWHYLDPLPA